MLFCFVLARLITEVFKIYIYIYIYLFAFLDNIYIVENKYVMCELLYNIGIYKTFFFYVL